ncbi:hypothetical protein D9M68_216600 [compost metagenome]
MLGVGEFGRSQFLHDPAGIHDNHPVAEGRDEPEIVRDENQAHAALGNQLVEDTKHFELHGDVKRRGRFVGDQQFRSGNQHHRDHRALAHTARNLVRVEIVDTLRIADLHGREHVERPLPGFAAADTLMLPERLDDLPADAHDRVQRIFRVLQDHRDALAPEVPTDLWRCREQIDTVEGQLLGRHLRMARRQPHDRPARLRLAGAAFADDAEAFAAEREGDATYRLDEAGTGRERDLEVFYRQQRTHWPLSRGSSASRRPSPSRLKPRLTIRIAMPGIVATHH